MNDAERTLPHNLEAERSTLGAILLHTDALHTIAEALKPEDFYRDAHRHIFAAMLAMPQDSIDLTTIKDWLARRGELEEVGGPAYIAMLVDGVPRSTNIEHYAQIIKQHAVRRGVIYAANKVLGEAYDAGDDPALVIDRGFSDLLALSQQSTGLGLRPVRDSLQATMEQLNELANPDSSAWGHRSGLQALDRKLRGFRPGKMVVIAGRPGDGKTSLALNVATAIAKSNKPVAAFSLEMDTSEVMLALVSAEAQVNIEDLADQKLDHSDFRRVSDAYETFNRIPLYVDDSTDVNPITLRAKARRMQIEHSLAAVVVDYVQLMQGLPTSKRNENEHEKLTGISRAIKLLSKDLAVPIIVCCQLNRAPEARQDGRPQLGDLRGSGSLEQDADVVILIHDPSKAPKRHGKASRKTADVVNEVIQKGVVELIVAKNRGLSTGSVTVFFEKTHVRFRNLEL